MLLVLPVARLGQHAGIGKVANTITPIPVPIPIPARLGEHAGIGKVVGQVPPGMVLRPISYPPHPPDS